MVPSAPSTPPAPSRARAESTVPAGGDAPTPPPVSTVAVVGLGTLGTGLVELLTRAGLEVVGIDRDPSAAQRVVGALRQATTRAVRRGELTARQRQDVLARLRTFTEPRAAATADLVLEAVPEDATVKRAVLADLAQVVSPDTVLATTTDALPVLGLATACDRPERVLGLHFFHPAPAMRLVEVVPTVLTAPSAVATATALARALDREPLVTGDRPGFLVNGLLFGYLNQAAAMYESGYASRDDIDAAMRLGCGLPMGPLELLDLVGLDTARDVLAALYRASGDRLYAPAPVLGRLAEAGLTGRRAGRGFYTYPDGAAPADAPAHDPRPAAAAPEVAARPVDRVGVVGTGTMATGIAEVFARAGHPVVLVGRSEDRAVAARDRVAASLARAVRRGRLGEADREAALGRLTATGDLAAVAEADLVVEAAVEDLAVKRELFGRLDRICRPGAVLATTTSSLPVTACARATDRPQDVVGMHFFNPAPVMRLVEVVRTVLTSDEAYATVRAVCGGLGKHPVSCGDRAGFIVNALLFPYLNNAVRLVEGHYATVAEVDRAMRLGAGYPMGPFELLDVVGLDVSLAIQETLYREFREPGLAPAGLLRELVAAGCLGVKSGRGFHAHPRRR